MNEPLKDIQEIIIARPDLQPEEFATLEKATPWMKAQLRPEVRAELEEEYGKKYNEQLALFKEENGTQIQRMMKEWKEEQQPLEKNDLQQLLSQEYISFDVPIMVGRHKKVKKDFLLVELPQEVEEKFVRSAQKHLIPIIEKMNAMQWTFNSNWAETLQKILDSIPDALTVSAELTSICLDPWEEDKDINAEWVRKNLSTSRIVKILIAQTEVNKFRDFFSNDFQLFRTLKRA